MHEGLVEPMENRREGEGQSDDANVQGNGQVGLVEANACTGENEENAIGEKLVTIGEALLTRCIELQALFDKSHMSTGLQGQILRLLFESRDSRSAIGEEVFDVGKLSLGELLTLKGKEGNAELGSVAVPASWKQLISMYQKLGMPVAQRWRICVGPDDSQHEPHLLPPHEEDVVDGRLECCCVPKSHKTYKKDCTGCGQKCEKCHRLRKFAIAFEYIEIKSWLGCMCRSRTFCHEMLEVWRNRSDWMGHGPNYEPRNVRQFWHGAKFREYQNFWNAESTWEGPQRCQAKGCGQYYKAFPDSMKSAELCENFNSERREYTFACTECGTLVEGRRILHKVLSPVLYI